MRDSDTEYIKRMGDRIAELERDRQMYVNSSDRLTAQVKELEATISEKDKCLYELEDEIIRLQPIIDAENKRIAELEAELAKIRARTCKACAHWYDEYHDGFATCSKWSSYSLPADPRCGGTHYVKTGKDGFCYLWAEKESESV